MIRLYIFVEGQTEETFVQELLVPYYANKQIYMTPILAETSRGHKGGIVNYDRIRNQLTKLCRQDSSAQVTTMIDLYGLPTNFPGMNAQTFPKQSGGHDQAKFLEERLANSINEPNFIPNLLVHEYEALLFSEPNKFKDWLDETAPVDTLEAIANSFDSPEHINNSPHTAPSKRILGLMPEYRKTLHGPLIAADIGLVKIREKCPHFNKWLTKLEGLSSS